MQMTKEIYDEKMREFGLTTYEELEEYRWNYSDEYESYIQSLNLICTEEDLSTYKLNCDKMHEFYCLLVDMYYFGLVNKLYK